MRRYATPTILLNELSVEPFLANTETLPFDNDDYTEDVFSKEGSLWDEFDKKDSLRFSTDFDEMIEKTFNNINLPQYE